MTRIYDSHDVAEHLGTEQIVRRANQRTSPMSDYHVHLHPHVPRPDSPPPGIYPPGHIDAFVERAASQGAEQVGFTEHLHRFVELEGVLTGFWNADFRTDLVEHSRKHYYDELNLHLETYVNAIIAARERGLPVLLGLEVDFFPQNIEGVLDVLRAYPFDYLVGSVHWVGAWAIDHPAVAHEFTRRSVARSYADYFALVTDLAASRAVDVIGHIDVVKKFGHRCAPEPVELYERAVQAALGGRVAIELSSAGLRYPAGEPYPSPMLLRMFAQAGVPITLASDAHFPEHTAFARRSLIAYARRAGYDQRLEFAVGGARQLVPLADSETRPLIR